MTATVKRSAREMTNAEWQTRCDLATLYRVAHHLGWTDLVNTHMSARVPGEPDWFLINRYGEMFDEVTASSLVKMDLDGNPAEEGGGVNEFGFAIHSSVYKARPDANYVLHTHTRAGSGVALLKRGLRPISQDAMHVYDDVGYHEYNTPGSKEDCEGLGRACATANCIIMLNHGLLTLGPHVHGAFLRMYTLDRACETEILARTLDEPVIPLPPDFVARNSVRMRKYREQPGYGRLEWEGIVRTVERQGLDHKR